MFLGNNPALSQRTKHISIREHFTRQYIEEGIIKIVFVKSKYNDADIFTKNLSTELFERHKGKIMYGKSNEERKDDND